MIYKFDMQMSGNSVSQTTAAVFQVGSGFTTANNAEANSATHSRVAVNVTATGGSFQLRDMVASANSSNLSGSQSITWVINNSGSTLTYKAPDGTYETVANDTFDLWAGTTRIFNEAAATTTTQTLSDIKFMFTAGTATIDIDNIVIDPIPSAPATPTASSVSSSGFTVNWSAVTGATGYRLDVATDSAFTSLVSGYNDLAVSGTSAAVTGLSPSTTYYVRMRTENFAGTSNHSSTLTQATVSAGTPALDAVTLSSALSSTYGTASSGVSFTASGSSLTDNITATAQTGYEVSNDNSTFGSSVSVASGSTVHVRFAATRAAGTYNSTTAVVLSSTGATNVNVTTSASGNTMSQKGLTITGISIANKEYDRLTTATITGTAAYSGLVNSESFTVAGAPSASFADKTVATGKSVTVSGYTAPSANYSVTQPTGLTANITAKALTLSSPTVTTKTYDGLTGATITGTLTGIISGDTVTLVGTGTFASVNAGTGISVTSTSTLGGADGGNYTLTQPTGLTGTINTKGLTITGLSAGNKTYDGTMSVSVTGTPAYSGLVNGETFSVTGTVSWAFADANVGTAKSLSRTGSYDAPSSNYTVTQPTLTANITSATPPTLTAASGATVDGAFVVTFPDNALWRSNITTISVANTNLTNGFTVGEGTITFTPSASSPASLLQSSGSKTIVVNANNYAATTSISQTISPGAANNLLVSTQPTAPASNGGALAMQPVVTIRDQYNNTVTTSSASVTAAVGSGTWTLGGTTTVNASSGVATFSGLSATSSAAVAGANITFTLGALSVTSSNFNIPVPTLGTYAFAGTTGSLAATGVAANVTLGNIALTGINQNSAVSNVFSGGPSSGNWGSVFSNTRYLEFTITAVDGFRFTAADFIMDVWRTSAGAGNYTVRSSVDNYASDLATGSLTTSQTSISRISLSSASFANLSSVTFRIYGWGGGSTGDFRVDNIIVRGTVQAGPAITIDGVASETTTSFSTTYGTASAVQTFAIVGNNLTTNITATAPAGFEVSSDATNYGSTAIFTQTNGLASGTLHLRLAATAGVGGSYNSQTVSISSTGATTRNITTAASGNTVNTQTLTITGLTAQNKNWDGTTSATVTGTPAYSGLVNGESFSVTGSVTWVFADANVGTNKSLSRTGDYGAPSVNYTVTQPTLTADISAVVASAPTITGITAGDGQLSVAFTAPSSNGGASIGNFQYSTDGGTNWLTPDPPVASSPLLITGLINGTTYNVQLRAVNSAGSGTASSTTQGTPVATGSPLITVSTILLPSALTTTYGTPSEAQTFTVSGSFLTGNLTVAASTGWEVSSDGMNYSSSVELTASSGAANATISVRLAATAAVTGSYNSQNITVSGGGATTKNVATASSGNSVAAKGLTITGLSAENKTYDGTTSVSVTGTPAYGGLVNGESFAVTDTVAWAFPNASVGASKTLTRTGNYSAPSSNYTVTQPTLTADITQATAPTLTAAVGATVDNPFEITFTETSSLWRDSITSITVDGTTLSASAYNTSASGKITLNPANSALLQSAGPKSIIIIATGHSNGTVTQVVGAGTPVQLSVITQPTAPSANGGALATQPVVRLLDLYNNVTTSTANVTAAATQGTWTLAGTTTVAAVNGTATFSGLTATSAAAVTGVTISFSSTGLIGATSSTFNISAPPAANDTTGTAVALTVGASATNGSFAGATPTFPASSTFNDVWYTFVATSTSHTLTVTAASETDPDIRVYEGTGASFNTAPTGLSTPTPLVVGQLLGVNEETVIATNFVVGRTYFVMVQDDGNTGGSFSIGVRTANASIATWNPTWSGTAASPLAATSVDANLASGSISRIGLTGASNNNRYSASGWHTTANYLQVTLTAATGYRLNLNDAVLYGNWVSSGTGPSWYIVRSSLDNYASDVGYFDADSTSAGRLGAFKLPSTGYGQLSTISFRIYGSSTPLSSGSVTASGGTGGFSALRVTGAVVQIPVVTSATIAGSVGAPLSYAISATGAPTSYAISSGTLPAGLSLSTATGVISGTPSVVGSGTVVSVTASNSAGTSSAANLTFNIAPVSLTSDQIAISPSEGGAFTASGPDGSTFSITYSGRTANGITTTYSSATPPTAPGYYIVTATATGNYSGSNSSSFHIAGLVAAVDSVARPAGDTTFNIPVATLLQNDARITSAGDVVTTGLSVTAVAPGTGGPTVSVNGAFVTFTAGGSETESFTYTLTDSVTNLTSTGTVTVTPQASAGFLAITGTIGTPVFDGVFTSITMTFSGTPDTTYLIEYRGDMSSGSWKSAGGWYSENGTFAVEIQEEGNHVVDWGNGMFFRGVK